MFEWVANPEAWVALATLAALEIVLGIDNIIFISILVGRLPQKQREPARFIGLALAMLTRLALLFSIVWIMGLVEPWFTVLGMEISGRDIILVGGGLFLIAKATHEIHNSLEGAESSGSSVAAASFGMVLVQIAILDIVFSLDSVITAVGLVDEISIMAIAIVLAVLVMLVAAKPIGDFVDRHPTVKMLALSFLIMVGLTLIVEGFDVHVPKGYIYFAMAFSMVVEMLNLRLRSKQARQTAPVQLHKSLRENGS
ncbi:Membrane protein TerC, possibly involved in tellurium resistance [Microbulbifer donghaiensis]|uniref:Membrane protein TerC, possibly involved in tellurium resistance n=1 Tax=Microbulbifer donghaiensis TaxID=494016 RepID=A0A1M5FHL2_9GAMM|nr:TerC family protein [Microbulbifer donghaiensis]SHF91003.1 Membrane protein TerC, possibly involved in tellurium resistance [Microbulbifer donghaiensis]